MDRGGTHDYHRESERAIRGRKKRGDLSAQSRCAPSGNCYGDHHGTIMNNSARESARKGGTGVDSCLARKQVDEIGQCLQSNDLALTQATPSRQAITCARQRIFTCPLRGKIVPGGGGKVWRQAQMEKKPARKL